LAGCSQALFRFR